MPAAANGVADPSRSLPWAALGVWAAASGAIAVFGHGHWSVAPAIWLAWPAVQFVRGRTASWGLAWPRPRGRSLAELLVAAALVVSVAGWVARWAPAGPCTVGVLLLHALWIAPSEECFFRGYVQGALRGRCGRAGAAGLSAGLFALSHVLITRDPAAAATVAPGLLFAAARERERSLLGPVLLHAMANMSLLLWSGSA